MSTTPPPDSIGQRVRARRELRGWSSRFLASRAGVAPSTLSRIERGLRSADNRYMIADLARALECSVTDLTGQPFVPADRELEAAHGQVNGLRAAVVEAAAEYPPDDDRVPSPMPLVETRYGHAEARLDAYDFATAADLLTQVLPDVHAHAAAGDQRAGELLVRASFNASSVFRHLGYPADALLAAERCRDAARMMGDPVALGVAEMYRAMGAAQCVGYRLAYTVAERATDALQPRSSDPDGLAVLGMLHLTSAYAALGQHRHDDAFAHVAEAETIAERTGETRAWGFYTGPADVRVWRIGLEVDAGNPGRAVEVARSTPAGELPAFRKVYFYADLARALAGTRGRERDAVRALLTAERIAPQHVRPNPLARETARYLLSDARRPAGGSELRGLCERLGVEA